MNCWCVHSKCSLLDNINLMSEANRFCTSVKFTLKLVLPPPLLFFLKEEVPPINNNLPKWE